MNINLKTKAKIYIFSFDNCQMVVLLRFTYQWLCPEISFQYKSLWNEATEVCIVEVFYVPGREAITEGVSWDSLLLAGFRSQVPLGFKGEEKQGKFDWMGLFVGTARLNACHSLTDQLGSAESPIGVDQHSCQISPQTHKYTDTYLRVLPQLTWTIYFYLHPSRTVGNSTLVTTKQLTKCTHKLRTHRWNNAVL